MSKRKHASKNKSEYMSDGGRVRYKGRFISTAQIEQLVRQGVIKLKKASPKNKKKTSHFPLSTPIEDKDSKSLYPYSNESAGSKFLIVSHKSVQRYQSSLSTLKEELKLAGLSNVNGQQAEMDTSSEFDYESDQTESPSQNSNQSTHETNLLESTSNSTSEVPKELLTDPPKISKRRIIAGLQNLAMKNRTENDLDPAEMKIDAISYQTEKLNLSFFEPPTLSSSLLDEDLNSNMDDIDDEKEKNSLSSSIFTLQAKS